MLFLMHNFGYIYKPLETLGHNSFNIPMAGLLPHNDTPEQDVFTPTCKNYVGGLFLFLDVDGRLRAFCHIPLFPEDIYCL